MDQHYVVAVSHIDIAYIEREEASEEMLDILLERVLSVMDRRQEVRFALEQVMHYKGLQQRRPDLFARVKEYLRQGRMEFMGGMITTADTNFPSGESLIRNQAMGIRWLEENLGVRPKLGWLMDTFGLNAQVPQIMKQFGFRHVYADRFGGALPHDMFQAEGLDGSRVLMMGRISNAPKVIPTTQAFLYCHGWNDIDRLFQRADALPEGLPKLVSYYIENEGPFNEYYLALTRERGWKLASYQDYSDAVDASGYEAPVVNADLNPEFTGTFALRSPIKTENRKIETMLMEAELWQAFLDNRKEMDEAWWNVFFCQFHDVFTGSCSDRTYLSVMNRYAEVKEASANALRETLKVRPDAASILVRNSLPFPRKEWVRIGNKLILAEMQPCGIRQFPLPTEETVVTTESGKEISNEFLRLVLDEQVGIAKLESKNGQVFLAGTPNLLSVQADMGGLQIESCDGTEVFCGAGQMEIGSAQEDASGMTISLRGTFPAIWWNNGKNTLSWQIHFTLNRGERALRMRIELDWHGQASRIRLNLPAAFHGRDVFYEVPFGVTRREAYRSRPTAKGEWPVQRFAAMEDGERGFALINRGIAGVEQEGNTLITTLLRAFGPNADYRVPATDLACQNGTTSYDFMLLPYEGSFLDADVLRTAQAFNQPLEAIEGVSPYAGDASLLSVDSETVLLSAVKPAWDGSGDLILRLYESAGANQTCTVTVAGMREANLSDVQEAVGEKLDGLTLSFKPYEIKTLRIKR